MLLKLVKNRFHGWQQTEDFLPADRSQSPVKVITIITVDNAYLVLVNQIRLQ